VARTLSDLVNLWVELVVRKEHLSSGAEVNPAPSKTAPVVKD
jgi:hypothetical protein